MPIKQIHKILKLRQKGKKEIIAFLKKKVWVKQARNTSNHILAYKNSHGLFPDPMRIASNNSKTYRYLKKALYSFIDAVEQERFYIKATPISNLDSLLDKSEKNLADKIIKNADRLCQHKFDIFELKNFQYGKKNQLAL